MGRAAYRRGSALLRRQLAAEQRDPLWQLMDELNRLEKYPDAGTPFRRVEIVEGHGGWWIKDPRPDGYGFHYTTLREVMRRWRVVITGYAAGSWEAEPLPAHARRQD